MYRETLGTQTTTKKQVRPEMVFVCLRLSRQFQPFWAGVEQDQVGRFTSAVY
jgi:hypothetical protein